MLLNSCICTGGASLDFKPPGELTFKYVPPRHPTPTQKHRGKHKGVLAQAGGKHG